MHLSIYEFEKDIRCYVPVVIKEIMNSENGNTSYKRNRCYNRFCTELYFVNRTICGFWFKMKMNIIYIVH